MNKKAPAGRLRIVLSLLGVCLVTGVVLSFSGQVSSHDFLSFNQIGAEQSEADSSALDGALKVTAPEGETGTLQKMIVTSGKIAMDVDLNRLGGGGTSEPRKTTINFTAVPDAFFTSLIFNDEYRTTLPSSMGIIPQNSARFPASLNASFHQLVVESTPWGGGFDLVIRDGKTGFVFFNIEGQQISYEPNGNRLTIQGGRLLMSPEFAADLGRPSDAGSYIGTISINATMRAIEVTQFVNGDIRSDVLPAQHTSEVGTVPGPDVIVGDLSGLSQFGSSAGTQVGLAVGTDSCNAGTIDLDWFADPSNDHPVIPQNLYRMSGGVNNDERFEQIGQSNVKHAFTALAGNTCGFGCPGTVSGTHLGSGCSDPYGASLNAGPNLGSRAWINPFTGAYPRGDSSTPSNNHSGHSHLGPSHRILTEINDLTPSLNPGASYVAEAQYVTPHEYVWCQANPAQCNMYNNVSYRKYTVTSSGSPFSFSAAASTVRMQAAIASWPGANFVQLQPAPGVDGIGTIAYKVTSPSPGVYHYEYALYNQNIDRAIQSFSIPLRSDIALSNIGFHAPPQQPGWTFDGTIGNTGFSNTPWNQTRDASSITFSSETFAQNPNANAVRWGTLYNIRFDTDRPPTFVNATIGFLKTGAPVTARVLAPRSATMPCIRYDPDTPLSCS